MQLQDLNPGLLKTSVLPTYHTDSQTCVGAQQTSEINLKTGSEFGVLGNWQPMGRNTYTLKKKKKKELMKKTMPEQLEINKGYFKVLLTIDLLVNK